MKLVIPKTTGRNEWAAIATIALMMCGVARAADTTSPKPARSLFIVPTSPQEGHDPFYPQSTRPYGTTTSAPVPKVEWTSLKLVGISGSTEHRLVIINNNTFAEGDEQDVPVAGSRVHVRCLKINTNSVTLMVGGQTRELDFSNINQ